MSATANPAVRPSRFSSLRWKLTLSYLGILLLLVTGFGVYQYVALRHSLIAARVSALEEDVNVAKALLSRSALRQQRLGALCLAVNREATAQTVATAVSNASGHTVGVTIYGRSGDYLAQAPADQSIPQISGAGLATAQSGTRSAPEVVSTDGGQQLLLAFPLNPGGQVCGVVQLSASLNSEQTVLRNEVLLLTIGGLAALLIGLLAGLLITGRALRPLQRLRDVAGQLAQGKLGARSRLAPRNDEIGELTLAFDEMAQGIERAFAAQQESEQQVRRFIADASHELRTPVTALKGYIDVMQRGAVSDPQAMDHALGAMSREAERMRVLVLDLLTLARLDSHRPLQVERVDLADVINQTLDDAGPGLASPQQLHRNFATPPVIAKADSAAVTTIVRNLFVNACKYAPGAEQFWSTSSAGNMAILEVRDSGPGIAAEDVPHLFERFYRGSKTRAREDGGSGLGLSIVKGLVEAQGGAVSAQSTEGQGTTFRVALPVIC